MCMYLFVQVPREAGNRIAKEDPGAADKDNPRADADGDQQMDEE